MNQTAAAPPKPLPVPSELARPFWDALKKRELRLQRCDACGFYNHPPRIACPGCHARAFTWAAVKPEGVVYSYTIVHRAPIPAFKADLPYAVALVDIAGTNARLLSNLLPGDEPPRIGMPVELEFEDASEEITLFRFRARAQAKPAGSR